MLQRFSVAALQCCSATFHVSALHVAVLRFMLQRVVHIAALLHVAALLSMLQSVVFMFRVAALHVALQSFPLRAV